MNTNWSDYERFLKPAHLKGETRTLTIVRLTEEETHPRTGQVVKSPVLWFKELPFGLVLSPTNRQTLIELYGNSIKDSIGKPIVVKAVAMKVAGADKSPIRIQKIRPNAPAIDTITGEITPVAQPEAGAPAPPVTLPGVDQGPDLNELDKFFGPRESATQPSTDRAWPDTEAEFNVWLKAAGINGQGTRSVLGTDAKSWMKINPGKSWPDVAKTIAATLGK